jgi:hypothetical protein
MCPTAYVPDLLFVMCPTAYVPACLLSAFSSPIIALGGRRKKFELAGYRSLPKC